MVKTVNRFGGITWGNNEVAIARDRLIKTRNTKTYLFNPSKPGEQPQLLFDLSYEDSYKNPGSFVTAKNQFGENTLVINGDKMYLTGQGNSPEGTRPFFDEFNLKTKATTRLWRADGKANLESISEVINAPQGVLLTRVESQTVYPNYYIRNTIKRIAPQQITFFENPVKSISEIHKEVIKYKRADGVDLSGTLYLPAGYDMQKKEKLPMILWAYPQEFKDASTAGQVTTSPHTFTLPSYGTPIFWVTRGYAVLDNAAFPIVGEGKSEPNDTFIEQLVANAKAAIDAVDQLGYIDRTRVGVGGHSYGAFMTANLLTHSDLFAAGIARSGAYNRTLTPFGFQNEERSYWEAPQVYNTMSPFMNADKMKTPLLLIHGEADNNTGTFPLQSERYFNALKGMGAPVRLVLLPKESHGYSARESVLHVLWEQDQWLEKWVKNKK
jgi:dipeptidyl aminopeptidase/acylaminoacyl peptidase